MKNFNSFESAKPLITTLAHAHGFDCVGFAKTEISPEQQQHLEEYISLGHHGSMGWMEARKEERKNPAKMWADVKTVISLGVNYSPFENPLHELEDKDRGVISVYARGDDYHEVIKKKLKLLAGEMQKTLSSHRVLESSNHRTEVKVFVDTAPIMEKLFAANTGIGWQGKHTNVVSRKFGSWLFLGEIFTNMEIEPDEPHENLCGSCSACVDVCPTNAIIAPGKIDARKCISYLTIENKSEIPHEYRKAIGNRIYGCDDCLAVCPWNKFAVAAKETAFHARQELKSPSLKELVQLDDPTFRQLFRKSPVKRIGRDRFVRNVLVAIGNSGKKEYIEVIKPLLCDPSPLVSEAAGWALKELENK